MMKLKYPVIGGLLGVIGFFIFAFYSKSTSSTLWYHYLFLIEGIVYSILKHSISPKTALLLVAAFQLMIPMILGVLVGLLVNILEKKIVNEGNH